MNPHDIFGNMNKKNRLSLKLALAVLGASLTIPWAVMAEDKPPVDIDDIPLKAAPVGKPQGRIGAASRSQRKLTEVFLFAPRQTSYTLSNQPTFYWYLTVATDSDIDFDITESTKADGTPASGKVVMKKTYEGDEKAGMHTTSLAAEHITLEPGIQYQVTIVVKAGETPADYPISGGYVMVTTKPAGLPDHPDGAAYAAAGLWYDAIDALEHQIAQPAEAAHAQRQLNGLLWNEHVFYTISAAGTQPSEADKALAKTKETERLQAFVKSAGAEPAKK